MSKAFTKEDDDGGFTPPPSSSVAIPPGPFRLTATGARRLARVRDPRIVEALARAEVLPPLTTPDRAALGVTVRVRGEDGEERGYRLVSPEERLLTGDGASVDGPLGRALLGAQVGDVRELRSPRGVEEVEILALEGEPPT